MAKISRVTLERKRELEKPDRILVFLQTAGDFINRYRRQALTAAGLVVVAALIVTAVSYFGDRSARASYDGLAIIMDSVDGLSPVEQKQRYKSFYDTHRRSPAGKIAGIKYAEACFQAGDITTAVEAYRQSVSDFKKQDLFRFLALTGLGYAFEADGLYDEAARCFQTIADSPAAANRDMALFNLGRMYDLMGRPEESREVFIRLAEDFPLSMYAPLAGTQIPG